MHKDLHARAFIGTRARADLLVPELAIYASTI